MTEVPTLTPEQAVAAGIQSPNWERWNSYAFAPGEDAPWENGREVMPRRMDLETGPVVYDLITSRGIRLVGFVQRPERRVSRSSIWVIPAGGDQRPDFYHYSAIIAWKEKSGQSLTLEEV